MLVKVLKKLWHWWLSPPPEDNDNEAIVAKVAEDIVSEIRGDDKE